MKIYYKRIMLLVCFLVNNKILTSQIVISHQVESNNAAKLVSYFLRDILGGIVGLKANQGNSQEASASLKQVLNGMAGVVETVLEDNKMRIVSISVEDIEVVILYLKKIINNSFETDEGQKIFDSLLNELKSIEKENK